jgi:uncharacterized protein (TIGR02271 family)
VIRDRSEDLDAFHTRHFAKPVDGRQASANGYHGELTDEQVIGLARGARNATKFEALWGGDTSGYASPSEADQALVSLLAFYTQDEGQLDSLYQRSGLCREKWMRRSGYRHSTIDKALSGLSETYTPSDDGARMVVGNGHASLPSPSPSLYKDEGRGRKPEAVRFSEMEVPGPRRYLVKDLVLAAYVTLLYGDGGVAKSLLALALADEDELRVQRSEEELRAGTREREAGAMRVRKRVRTDRERIEVPTKHEEVSVERVPVSGEATDAQIGEDEVSVPVTEEEVVVDKRAVAKEEVRLRKDVVEDTEVVEEDVHREEVDVEDATERGRDV